MKLTRLPRLLLCVLPLCLAACAQNAQLEKFHARQGDTRGNARQIAFDAPRPNWKASVGSTVTSRYCDHPIRNAGYEGAGDLEVVWERRYTKDSDHDGKNDASPDWIMVAARAVRVDLQGSSSRQGQCEFESVAER